MGNLTEYENIYAMTASNASLSSWAAYCGSEATVDGVSIGSCLGDLFSINWMEDTEANNPDTETLLEQQSTVTELTTASPVQTFGTTEAYEALQKEIAHRRFVDGLFAEHFSHIPENNGNVQNYDCLRLMVGEVEELCGIWSDYSLKY